MAATVTVTGTAGPNITVTAAVFNNVDTVEFDCIADVISLYDVDNFLLHQISITAATTITATKSGSTYTFTIS